MKEKEIAQEVNWAGLKIQRLEIDPARPAPYSSISNIRAVDENGALVWQAEDPKTHYDYYYDMQIDTQHGVLICMSSVSYRYEISLKDGRILSYMLVK